MVTSFIHTITTMTTPKWFRIKSTTFVFWQCDDNTYLHLYVSFTMLNTINWLQYNNSNLLHIQKASRYQSDHTKPWSWSYGSWIYNYIFNQWISHLKLWVWTPLMARCTRYNIMWWSLSIACCRSVVFLVSSLHFPEFATLFTIISETNHLWATEKVSSVSLFSSTNKTGHHDIA
jgi:hypothetical protein